MIQLKDICTKIGSGATPTGGKSAYLSQGISLIRSQNVLDYTFTMDGLAYINENQAMKLNNVEVQKGDILLNITGDSVARACIVPNNILPARVNQHVAIIRVDEDKADNNYVLYSLIKSKKSLLSLAGGGATRNALTKKMIEEFEIELPQLSIQKKISAQLSEIDDKIAVNRRICENLEAQAQALFKHWFIDFAPFLDKPSGKAERKNGKFVESELGMIPEGWRVGTLEELVDIKYGKDHKKLNEGNIPAYGSAGLMRTVEEKLYDGESVLIPRKGTLNNIMYVNEAFWTVDTMFYTIPKKSNILKYLYMKLKRIDFNKMNVGTSIPSNSTSQLNKLKIVVPTDEILSRFDGIMSSLLQEIMHSQKESSRLSTLRDTLLPKLMSGQIKV